MTEGKVTSLIIADDQVMFAEGLSAVLDMYSELKVIGIANSGERLFQILNAKQPGLILLDLNMPGMDGFEACELIRKNYPDIVVVAVTMYDDAKVKARIKEAGAAGMLLKFTASKPFVEKLQKIMQHGNNGTFTTDNSIEASVMPSPFFERDKFLIHHKISERELDIIKLIAEGHNSDEIAEKLFLSDHTVKTHRKNILEKLQMRNTAELIHFMHKNAML